MPLDCGLLLLPLGLARLVAVRPHSDVAVRARLGTFKLSALRGGRCGAERVGVGAQGHQDTLGLELGGDAEGLLDGATETEGEDGVVRGRARGDVGEQGRPQRRLPGVRQVLPGSLELAEERDEPRVRLLNIPVGVVDKSAAVPLDIRRLVGENPIDGAGQPGVVLLAALNGLADRRRLRFGARVAPIRELPCGEPLGVAGWSLRLALAELLKLRGDRGLPALELVGAGVELLKLCPPLASR